eukprot:gene19590-30178_t
MSRVCSLLVTGQGIALYPEGLSLKLPHTSSFLAVEMRATAQVLLFHPKTPRSDGKPVAKISLMAVHSAMIEGPDTTRITLQVSKQPASGSSMDVVSGTLQMETFELAAVSAELLDEVLLCIHQQQLRAYRSELGRVRRSLRPAGARMLDIVHFNDVYHLGAFKTEEPRGGVTRFYHQLEVLRRTKNPLVLFSGDFVGPSLMSVITKGKQMVDALNFIRTHYGVFGNHEFDFGLRNLEKVIHGYTQGDYIFAGSNTEWLMTNMDGSDGDPLGGGTRKKLFEWNGIRVGILGLCENWLPHCPRLAKGEASYRDIFEVGESEARALKAEGAEIVLALTHNRLSMDRDLTDRCPSIDLLLGGHDHFYKKELDRRLIKSGEEFQWLSEVLMQ